MKYTILFTCGFALGIAALLLLLTTWASRNTRQTPQLKQANTITIFLHPWSGYEAATNKAVLIPDASREEIYRRLVPEKYYGSINDQLAPIEAEAVVTHPDATQTRVFVREGGINPAIVSIDGVNYFYAKNESGVYSGAIELVRMVAELASKQHPPENQPVDDQR